MFADFMTAGAIFLAIAGGFLFYVIHMPNTSFKGDPPPLTSAETALAGQLRAHVTALCKRGPDKSYEERNYVARTNLALAEDYLIAQLTSYGYKKVSRQKYTADGESFANIEAELAGTTKPEEILVIGAHYDSVTGSPGANDNASGTAGVLALAQMLSGQKFSRTVKFVAFVNEEPPFFQTGNMGSLVYANAAAKRKENIIGMISLETIGYFSDTPGSQRYPPPFNFFYPDKGDFIAFVGNLASRSLVHDAIDIFRKHAGIPSEGVAAPAIVPGIGWSDHWAFWMNHYPAIMITDTAPFRYPYYHHSEDTPDKLDYQKMARVVMGVRKISEALLCI